MSETIEATPTAAVAATSTAYSTRAAANYLGVSVSTLNAWRLAKTGPVYEKMGRRVVYHLEDLYAFRESRRVKPQAGV